jgi:cytochrome c oxidase assembly protein subunit 11
VDKAIARTVGKLGVAVVVMFAFVFVVMVPLYDTFCEVFGLNGKYTTGQYQQSVVGTLDESRTIKVQFVANNAADMPWGFRPAATTVHVHPGEVGNIIYNAHNGTGHDMVAQAVPSFVPARAAQYFHKTECFCFQRQPLKAGEQAELPMQFIIDRDLPSDIQTISVSYTIFDITEMAGGGSVAVR